MKRHIIRLACLVLSVFLWWVVSVYASNDAPVSASGDDKWIILFLVGLIQAIVGYVYVSGIKELKENIKELWDKKVDKEYHKAICPEEKK